MTFLINVYGPLSKYFPFKLSVVVWMAWLAPRRGTTVTHAIANTHTHTSGFRISGKNRWDRSEIDSCWSERDIEHERFSGDISSAPSAVASQRSRRATTNASVSHFNIDPYRKFALLSHNARILISPHYEYEISIRCWQSAKSQLSM